MSCAESRSEMNRFLQMQMISDDIIHNPPVRSYNEENDFLRINAFLLHFLPNTPWKASVSIQLKAGGNPLMLFLWPLQEQHSPELQDFIGDHQTIPCAAVCTCGH